MMQIRDGESQLHSAKGSSSEFALVIDGKSLAFALDGRLKKKFLDLALGCASVICCRSTPKHKALVSFFFHCFFVTCALISSNLREAKMIHR